MQELLAVDGADWIAETHETAAFLARFGKRLPSELRSEHTRLAERLGMIAGAEKK
jgi:GTP-dependent phosphoenolpyruvate carboxykinase